MRFSVVVRWKMTSCGPVGPHDVFVRVFRRMVHQARETAAPALKRLLPYSLCRHVAPGALLRALPVRISNGCGRASVCAGGRAAIRGCLSPRFPSLRAPSGRGCCAAVASAGCGAPPAFPPCGCGSDRCGGRCGRVPGCCRPRRDRGPLALRRIVDRTFAHALGQVALAGSPSR